MTTGKVPVLLLSLLTLGSISTRTANSADANMSRPTAPQSVQLPVEGKLPSLQGAVEWLNSEPLSPAQLRGKVVLVEFWTYTCINWRRTLPYVHAWAEKYKNHGLVVIGVHTPEFDFEKDRTNVQHAVNTIKIDFPVAVDSNYAIWNSFGNRYWPALYFVDAQGRIRHHQFGEGSYDQSERVLQQLLTEAGKSGWSQDLTPVNGQGAEAAADWNNLKSGETYLAYERSESFASPGGMVRKANHTYAIPARLDLNEWALSGDWTAGTDAVLLNRPGGRIAYRFHARDVHLIMGSAQPGRAVRFRVLIDGQPPGTAHGIDVDAQGNGAASEPRMYQLIRQPGPIQDRQFEIEFLDPGVQAFDFTFG